MTNETIIIDEEATLARFTDGERLAYLGQLSVYLDDLEGWYCEDEAQAKRKAMCRALGLRGYTEGIWAIDPTLNPVALEEFMRGTHGTLNHLPHETFVLEAKLARMLEDSEPGALAKFDYTADEGEHSPDFLQAEKLVQERRRIIVPGTGLYREPRGVSFGPSGMAYGRPII